VAALHLSKVAFNCASFDTLARRQQARVVDGIVPLVTRFMPKRAEELVGGSLYWIMKHRLIARNRILGFATREQDGRTIIQLDPELVLPDGTRLADSLASLGPGQRVRRTGALRAASD